MQDTKEGNKFVCSQCNYVSSFRLFMCPECKFAGGLQPEDTIEKPKDEGFNLAHALKPQIETYLCGECGYETNEKIMTCLKCGRRMLSPKSRLDSHTAGIILIPFGLMLLGGGLVGFLVSLLPKVKVQEGAYLGFFFVSLAGSAVIGFALYLIKSKKGNRAFRVIWVVYIIVSLIILIFEIRSLLSD